MEICFKKIGKCKCECKYFTKMYLKRLKQILLNLIIKQWIKTRSSCLFEKLYLLDVSIFADIIFNSEKMTNLKRQNKLCIFKKKKIDNMHNCQYAQLNMHNLFCLFILVIFSLLEMISANIETSSK